MPKLMILPKSIRIFFLKLLRYHEGFQVKNTVEMARRRTLGLFLGEILRKLQQHWRTYNIIITLLDIMTENRPHSSVFK